MSMYSLGGFLLNCQILVVYLGVRPIKPLIEGMRTQQNWINQSATNKKKLQKSAENYKSNLK